MSYSELPLVSGALKKDPMPKFIVIRPDDRLTPKLFVSNDPEDGYDLTFQSLAEFETWRQQEEEAHSIEFVKGDAHGSRTNPPRFKEHVKLVCARHSRRGRKQYVKKYPERTRKLPSRKIEGTGCPASICYKTYLTTDVVRVMYHREHSHPTGPENFPFTKKGRKILAARDASLKGGTTTSATSNSEDESLVSNIPSPVLQAPLSFVDQSSSLQSSAYVMPSLHASQPEDNHSHAHGGHMTDPHLASEDRYGQIHRYEQPCDFQPPPHQRPFLENDRVESPPLQFPCASPTYDSPPLSMDLPQVHTSHDRWDRLATLFRSVHTHALGFEYPEASVNALENVLVKLYLESPLAGSTMSGEAGLGMDVTGMGPGGTHMSIDDVEGMDEMGYMMEGTGLKLDIPRGHEEPQVHSNPHGLQVSPDRSHLRL